MQIDTPEMMPSYPQQVPDIMPIGYTTKKKLCGQIIINHVETLILNVNGAVTLDQLSQTIGRCPCNGGGTDNDARCPVCEGGGSDA